MASTMQSAQSALDESISSNSSTPSSSLQLGQMRDSVDSLIASENNQENLEIIKR